MRLLASLALASAVPAWGLGLEITPRVPTPMDTIVLSVEDAASCAYIPSDPVEMTDGRVIRVRYEDGSRVLCIAPNPKPTVVLGRLPSGSYVVQLVAEGSGFVSATRTLTVAYPPAASLVPPDDYSGHWLTDRHGEGVFVAQHGSTAFVSFLYPTTSGPSWAVIPGARWERDPNGALRFFGQIWQVGPLPPAGQAWISMGIGFGSFYPSTTFDQARIETHIPQLQSRPLTRFRF